MAARTVSIRPYVPGDVPGHFEAVTESIASHRPWMPSWFHAAYSMEESRTWVERQVRAFPARTEFDFVIVSLQGRFLGGCGLNSIDRDNLRARVGYWVRSSEAGRRIASEALGLLAVWAFENTDLVRLEIIVATGNLVGHRVAEHAGAVREGVLRSRLLVRGAAHDATMFSIVRGRAAPA